VIIYTSCSSGVAMPIEAFTTLTQTIASVTIGYMIELMDRHIVCLQIPAFGIALARTNDVSLRNRPVVMAPVHTSRALVREASLEASQEGIEPGMSVELARRLCPGLRLVPPDSPRLHAGHRELEHTILPFAPAWESTRPGSLFLDLTGTARLFGPPIDTAARIGRELTHRQGLNGVIGLAGNKLVSQLAATTLERPPQVLSIQLGSEQPFLAPLPATLLPGLHRTQASQVLRRLDDLNLRTLGSIAAVSLTHLELAFGATAGLLHDWALGIDPSPVRPPVEQSLIEQSLALHPDEVDDQLLLGRLYGLLEHLCAALRLQRRVCRRLLLAIRHSDHHEQVAHQMLRHGTYWEADLRPVLVRLFIRCFQRRVRLQRMTLQVDHLQPPAEQLSLFQESKSVAQPMHHRLSLALDRIRGKFGGQAISWGRTLR
jgi:DNA polymerase IV